MFFSSTLYPDWFLFKMNFLQNWDFGYVTLRFSMSKLSSPFLEIHFIMVCCLFKWESLRFEQDGTLILLACCWHRHESTCSRIAQQVHLEECQQRNELLRVLQYAWVNLSLTQGFVSPFCVAFVCSLFHSSDILKLSTFWLHKNIMDVCGY